MELYFLALLPPEEINSKIKELKLEFAEKYGAKRALRLPAHITVQIPFKMDERNEHYLIKALDDFAENEKAFQINLSGFGNFSKKTVFVDVSSKEIVQEFFERLQNVIAVNVHLKDHEKTYELYPHLTIATRDLHKKNFLKAWEDFGNRKFEDSFMANALTLFKHNHKTWDILKQFKF